MYLDSDKNETNEKQKEEPEEEKLTCPECRKAFQDMRGLTSHARHMHEIEKEILISKLENGNGSDNLGWKVIGGIGVIILTIITLGKIK